MVVDVWDRSRVYVRVLLYYCTTVLLQGAYDYTLLLYGVLELIFLISWLVWLQTLQPLLSIFFSLACSYQDGDRKIWMGPQFRLVPCDDGDSSHAASGGVHSHSHSVSASFGSADASFDDGGVAKGILNEFTKRISFGAGSLPESPQITVPMEGRTGAELRAFDLCLITSLSRAHALSLSARVCVRVCSFLCIISASIESFQLLWRLTKEHVACHCCRTQHVFKGVDCEVGAC